jgi:Nucleotidyltransferase domain
MSHIYVFGSVCRGEITSGSDVDLLAVTAGFDDRFDPMVYSIYSARRLAEIWREGNPFAWHLALESRMVYSSDGSDLIADLGRPSLYAHVRRDCEKFFALFEAAADALDDGSNSPVFELSTVFLAARNFATCYLLGRTGTPDFSRRSSQRMGPDSLALDGEGFTLLERARILCTRGAGVMLSTEEIRQSIGQLGCVRAWMQKLIQGLGSNERI